MNTAPASESGPYATNHTRPFFYAQPTAQQPFPNPWYLGQVYNPYCLPAPGFRSGNPYFPFYSVALQEYPGFYVPQPQVHARMSRRPSFNPHPPSPMFYHATRFRHFSSQARRTECKETQTEFRQPEPVPKDGNLGTKPKSCDAGNMTGHSSGVGTVNESISEHLESSRSSAVAAVQERDFHKNTCTSTSYRNLLPGSYAFEKEEVRIEYGSGTPGAIQLWKSYKETRPLYDVANDKDMADNIVQRDVYSVSSCEGVRYGSRPEGGEVVAESSTCTKDECRAAIPPVIFDAVHEKEIQCIPHPTSMVGLEPERRVKANSVAKPGLSTESPAQSTKRTESNSPQDFQTFTGKDNDTKNMTSSNDFRHQEEPNHGGQGRLMKPSMEEIEDLGLVNTGQMEACDDGLALWADDAGEGYVPSSSWLACFDNVENCNYDFCLSEKKPKRPSVLSFTSDDLSSRDEGSSMDNAPVSYYVPDYLLRKSVYSFRKSTDSSEKEKIKSSGSLNEDDECLRRETNVVGTQYNASRDKKGLSDKVEVSAKNRKLGISLRDVSRRKLYSLKKKPRKNMSLSEPEDSEDYWVVEETADNGCDDEETDDGEYFLHENLPQGPLSISNGKLCKSAPRPKVMWKHSKGAVPAQLIRWPSCEKVKTKKKGLVESTAQFRRAKQKEQVCEHGNCVQRATSKLEQCFKEAPEQRRSLQRFLGGKSQRGNPRLSTEEYWTGRGAKPKLSEQPYVLQPPVKNKEQEKPQRKRGLAKLSKSKSNLPEPEEVEVWVAASKGRGTRKTAYRR
ncbi:uncharacterized protein [Ambystoma mexicanum]|uniref:uncharacterized protein n=1 Tax=Ambystoma mexicanum TaxID=8296 RepID=UPI0037E847EA